MKWENAMKKYKKLNFNFYEFLCEKILNYFKNHLNLAIFEVEKLYLGIVIIILNISEMIIVFIIAFFMGIVKGIILFFIMFTALRLTAAGVHCKNSLSCIILTTIIYISSSYISINHPLSMHFNFIIIIISTLLLYKYSPADTENRPILGKDHRKKLKIQTTIIASILILINLLLLNKVLFNLTMFAFLFETLSILPCSYKFMKTNYNNYKKYELS